MKNRRRRARAPEAIVVVNSLGIAVDCNLAFARLCQAPAGMLVGQQLSGFAPELAAVLERENQFVDDAVAIVANQSFTLAVQPFMNEDDLAFGSRHSDRQECSDRVIRLRGLSLDEVA